MDAEDIGWLEELACSIEDHDSIEAFFLSPIEIVFLLSRTAKFCREQLEKTPDIK